MVRGVGTGVPEGQPVIETPEQGASSDDVADDVEPPLDVIFDILQNERRRRVLQYLRSNEGPVSISELSEAVAAYENDKRVPQLNSEERKRVYVGLYQCHLPKMDRHGFIRLNKGRGQVALNEAEAAQAFEYLDTPGPTDSPWAPYYLVLGAIGWTLFILGASLQGGVTNGLVAGFVFVCIAGTLLTFANRRLDVED